MKKLMVIIVTILFSASLAPAAEKKHTIPKAGPEREARMAWWREARFGMFVHWGLYSGLAGNWKGEKTRSRWGQAWIQHHLKIDTDTCAKEALSLFRPAASSGVS